MSNPLHPNLSGRVAVVTGSSRGIGKALALRLAQEGADVVVVAKSETSTEKLPGSIYDTAEEIRSLGRRAMAIPTDVRSDDAVRAMIDQTIEELGRVDILINNAGALWWQKVIDTPPKRFDLMMGVNVRAAYLGSYYALPHMIKQRWDHIINMCPGISTTPNPGRVCYMITKMGMARLAIGIAAEHATDASPRTPCGRAPSSKARRPSTGAFRRATSGARRKFCATPAWRFSRRSLLHTPVARRWTKKC